MRTRGSYTAPWRGSGGDCVLKVDSPNFCGDRARPRVRASWAMQFNTHHRSQVGSGTVLSFSGVPSVGGSIASSRISHIRGTHALGRDPALPNAWDLKNDYAAVRIPRDVHMTCTSVGHVRRLRQYIQSRTQHFGLFAALPSTANAAFAPPFPSHCPTRDSSHHDALLPPLNGWRSARASGGDRPAS
ncbi:hypothetical protein BD413DRAFT_205817 [Trametes elegans]|nr:hypothetical protein BD413DRAFT_205817 [Trametes elegans]